MKKEKEKVSQMCESIGHRPLQGRCPKRPKKKKSRAKKKKWLKRKKWNEKLLQHKQQQPPVDINIHNPANLGNDEELLEEPNMIDPGVDSGLCSAFLPLVLRFTTTTSLAASAPFFAFFELVDAGAALSGGL